MFLIIREGIAEELYKLQLREDTEYMEGWAGSFDYQLEKAVGKNVKRARAQSGKKVRDEAFQTAPQLVVSSTPELRKRLREPTLSPQNTANKKPEVNGA